MNRIVFLGDSYTWGEGLELFIETDKWKSQRQKVSNWSDIEPITDDNSNHYREKNRFPTIVSDYFGLKSVVDVNNSGSFSTNISVLNKTIANVGVDGIQAIVVQLSYFYRTPIHLTYECVCSWCKRRPDYPIVSLMEDVSVGDPTDINSHTILKSFKKDKIDGEFLDWFWKWTKWIRRYCYDLLEFKLKQYEDRGIPILFIDTWDEEEEYVYQRKYITDRFVPLIGKDEQLYDRWVDFKNTFGNTFDINGYFPNTNNHHPSLLAHQYIAKSVIQKLEKVL